MRFYGLALLAGAAVLGACGGGEKKADTAAATTPEAAAPAAAPTGAVAKIAATGAERVWLTHGSTGPMTRWLRERGLDAGAIATQFQGEADEPDPASEADVAAGETTPTVSAEVP